MTYIAIIIKTNAHTIGFFFAIHINVYTKTQSRFVFAVENFNFLILFAYV